MCRVGFGCLLLAAMLAGCGSSKVWVDGRLTPDSGQWHRLDGPTYRIVGVAPEAEASLEFQEVADLLERAFHAPRPNLRRASPAAVPAGAAGGRAAERGPRPDLVMTVTFQVFDRGTAVHTYPVYAHRRATAYSRHGRVYRYHSYGYAGSEVETVHMGFVHGLSLTAWVFDAAQPAGRRVIWEGKASIVRDEPDLRAAMPYLAVALADLYGQPTEGPVTVKFERHDERIERLYGGGESEEIEATETPRP